MSSPHLGTEMQYCKEEGPPAHTHHLQCVKGTIVLKSVRHSKHAKWRGSGLLSEPPEEHSSNCMGSCGSPGGEATGR